jgi:hypothetical protein
MAYGEFTDAPRKIPHPLELAARTCHPGVVVSGAILFTNPSTQDPLHRI